MASRRMEKVLEYCRRDNIDKRRLAEFWPKNRPEINNLPIYSVQEIDHLHEMVEAEYLHSPTWFGEWRPIKSCSGLFELLDRVNIGDDIIEVLQKPLDDMPLLVNECEPRVKLCVKWRLLVGK